MLFLWTTAPHLQESFQALTAWGFEYKTNDRRNGGEQVM
jgi:N6-adenosine-specific RNA methylase IME4